MTIPPLNQSETDYSYDEPENQDETSKFDESGNVIQCKFSYGLKINLEEICQFCEHFLDCQQSYMNWYLRLPFFIIDNYISKKILSHSALIIFIYLCRKANFDPSSNHFSRCWINFHEISEVTGISTSNMNKYIRELEDRELIKCTVTRKFDRRDGFKTSHEFTVYHVKILHDLRMKAVRMKDHPGRPKKNQ